MNNLLMDKLNSIEELIIQQTQKPLCLSEAAKYLDISKSMMYKLTYRLEIPHFKPNGKKIYFLKNDLDNWVTKNRIKTVSEIGSEIKEFK